MSTRPVVINEGAIKKGGLNPPPTQYRPPAPSPLKPANQPAPSQNSGDGSRQPQAPGR
jgi:hypothetical protein